VRLIDEANPHGEDLYLHMMAAPPATPCSWVPDNRSAVSGMTDMELNERWDLKERWALKF
jgi:hypothetical protein